MIYIKIFLVTILCLIVGIPLAVYLLLKKNFNIGSLKTWIKLVYLNTWN